MLPSRYFVVDERSPNSVKRRNRGRRENRGGEPAITLLPPDPYFIMDRPELNRSPSPTVYRAVPPKSAKNKEASSFVILGDTIRTPVQSRPGSPSGRVSPFRGHGFKSPTTTRPNSRVASPSDSPKKAQVRGKSEKSKPITSGARINRDIGLPPKSPMKISTSAKKPIKKSEESENTVTETKSTTENLDSKDNADDDKKEKGKAQTKDISSELPTDKDEENNSGNQASKEDKNENEKDEIQEDTQDSKNKFEVEEEKEDTEEEDEENNKEEKVKGKSSKISNSQAQEKKGQKTLTTKSTPAVKEKLFPAIPRNKEEIGSRKPPVSPRATTKIGKNESSIQQKHSVIKTTNKPPIPPKKLGSKSTLKSSDGDLGKKVSKGKSNAPQADVGKKVTDSEEVKISSLSQKPNDSKINEEKKEVEIKNLNTNTTTINLGDAILNEPKKPAGDNKTTEDKNEKKTGGGSSETEKLIPCFQPDKCQIAPPTMASPSPIITPTISTPSTTADLASSSMKNSQSIAAAPTTVTPSSLSSVSSTLVLTGNLAKKELHHKSRLKETSPISGEVQVENNNTVKESKEPVGEKEKNGSALDLTSDGKVSTQMVKAASKDSIKWSNKEKLSGEITSATKVIKAEPDMEVLSPNNLRNVPPRMPPPNLAWDEERLPNGDVPNKVEKEGRFRRFLSALWKFLSYLFCCRCMKNSKCCRKPVQTGPPKPSLLSKLNCFKNNNTKVCNNPFKCCVGCCKCKKPKCCDGRSCCRKKSDANQNAKPKAKKKSKSKMCCAKPSCSCKNCCDTIRNQCSNCRDKINKLCRSLFCLNMLCCQKMLKKCTFCHKLKCCQKNGLCSCFNPYVRKDPKKLHKKGSHASNNSRDKDQLDLVLVEHSSLMKAAIPVLPTCLAVFCLICNLFLPGFGTFFSGIFCLCFGKPRFSTKDSPKNRLGSFLLNTIIGIGQLFTVVFCLVGWGWSIWWGVIMYKLSRRQKRIKLAEKNQKEAEGSNVNHNHVDVEQG